VLYHDGILKEEEKNRMTRNLLAIGCAVLLAAGLSFGTFAGVAPDFDTDGVPDDWDNCWTVPNGPLAVTGGCLQTDTDLDGYGNECDHDYDQDKFVGGTDFFYLSARFGTTPPSPTWDQNVDSDCDDFIGGTDFFSLSGAFGDPIGPSGLACADPTGATAPCTP
jgi:hypothetical protein